MYENTFQDVVMFLRQGGSYKTKELSERFGVSQRTIQDYVKELMKNSGLKKDGTSYYFPDEFRNVDIQERVQMSTALMIALYKQAIPELKESVTSNFRELPKELDAFLFDINFETIDNEYLFNQIVATIMDKIAISFNYINKQNISSSKNVYPLKVTNMLGYWYLLAYDLEAQKIKTFYIKNITTLSTHDDSYLSPQQMKELYTQTASITSPWFSSEEKSVLLRVTDEAITYLKRKDDSIYRIIEDNASELLIEMKYYNDTEVLTFIKRWLPFITIVNSDILKKKLQEILTTSLQNYNQP
jgi:predicted DNA-binding transcriptional regulator YafY